MAKTLVGLYDTLTDAEHVRHALVTEGFPRGGIRAVTSNDAARRGTDASIGEWITAESGTNIVDTLTDLGIPAAEAHAYAEGIRRGGALVIVEASDEWTDRVIEIMHRRQAVDIDERIPQWRQEGWTGMATRAKSSPAAAAPATNVRPEARPERSHTGTQVEPEEEVTIPVVEEELTVGKREVQRGRVRIHTQVVEHPVEASVRLRDETVSIERHPVDRPATEADLAAGTDETIEVTEVDEEAVVSKQARVVEEVVVRKDTEEHTETVRGTVRRTVVDVDRDAEARPEAGQTASTRDFATYATDWQQHHGTTFLSRGTYADYEPAYRYGYELAENERYRGRDWAAMEVDARRDWESRHGGTWEQFKDAIRYGWDNVRART
jgi:uncharacterized protein (TIGR02271 family)